MAQMVAYIKEVNGRHIGDGVFYDEVEAARLIERGDAMDAREYRKMLEEDLKIKIPEKKAPEAPKKDKMVRAPMRKK